MDVNDGSWTAFAKFYDIQGGAKEDSTRVTVNRLYSLYNDIGFKSILGDISQPNFNDRITTWSITAIYPATTSFFFADTVQQPYLLANIPDTICIGCRKIFVDSVSNGDTITISTTGGIHVSDHEYFGAYSVSSDSLDISGLCSANSPSEQLYITLSITHHTYDTVNGCRYLFIKKYDQTNRVGSSDLISQLFQLF